MLIRAASCMAPNADAAFASVARYAAGRAGCEIRLIEGDSWREREELLDRGEAHLGWICGLPYVWKADAPKPTVKLLAAPVMAGARYQGEPIYFSDVIVRSESHYHAFDDLRGCRWAYNEPHSHSGHNLTRYHLASLGERGGFFGEVHESGAHENSLRMILDGQIDASAIDSTVLETACELDPDLAERLRIIATFGPSPIPPWVVSSHAAGEITQPLQEALLEMHKDPTGRAALRAARMLRFVRVTDADYDPIRAMHRLAQPVTLQASSPDHSSA